MRRSDINTAVRHFRFIILTLSVLSAKIVLATGAASVSGVSFVPRKVWWPAECSGVCFPEKEQYKTSKGRTRTRTVMRQCPKTPICGYSERNWVQSSAGRTAKVKGYKLLVWHHSEDTSLNNSPNLVSMVKFHRFSRPFHDLAYHFVIKKNAKGVWTIYEGTPLGWVGSHVQFHNVVGNSEYGALGIMVAGHFGKQQPDSALVKIMTRLQDAVVRRFHITDVRNHYMGPNRVLNGGTCPGKYMVPIVENLRKRVVKD